MPAPTLSAAIAAVGVDPRAALARLRSGNPAEISALAEAFATAAKATGLAEQYALDQQTYAVGGVHPDADVDVGAEVAATRAALGDSAAALRKIALLLGDVAAELYARTQSVQTLVDGLIARVDGLATLYAEKVALAFTPEDLLCIERDLAARARADVVDTATRADQMVTAYEAFLAGHLQALAALGFVPPSGLDEGPGDVDVPVAAVTAQQTLGAGDATALSSATAYLGLLVAKLRSGVALSTAEQTWLTDYLQRVGGRLAELRATGAALGAPAAVPLTRVGDALLLASQEGWVPASLQQVLDGDAVGEASPQTVPLSPTSGVDWASDATWVTASGTVAFLATYSSPGTAPGSGLAATLTSAAIRWKQQLNGLWAQIQGYGWDDFSVTEADVRAHRSDLVSSQALALAARNAGYANAVLVGDAGTRLDLMAMNWQQGTGAAEFLLAGVRPSEAVDAAEATAAARAVLLTAAGLHPVPPPINSDVRHVITGLLVTYVDALATDPAALAGPVDLTGRTTVTGLGLDAAAQTALVKLVGGFGVEDYTLLCAAARRRATDYLVAAMQAGDDPAVAVSVGGRLVGLVYGAPPTTLLDQVQVTTGPGAQAQTAKLVALAQSEDAQDDLLGLVTGFGGVPALPPAALNTTATLLTLHGLDKVFGPSARDALDQRLVTLTGDVNRLRSYQNLTGGAQLAAEDAMNTVVLEAKKATGQPVVAADGTPVSGAGPWNAVVAGYVDAAVPTADPRGSVTSGIAVAVAVPAAAPRSWDGVYYGDELPDRPPKVLPAA